MKSYLIRLLLIGSLVLSWAHATVAPLAAQGLPNAYLAPVPVAPVDNGAPLQFTSAGHALSFHSNQFLASNGQYALRVQFLGARATTPLSDAPRQLSGPNSQITPQAPALSQVRYPNLWPGITLTYDAPAGSVLQSTYRLAPGADPQAIRLRYNLPVRLSSQGGLLLRFKTGELTESAPLAWQEIKGQRIPVAIGFIVDDDHIVSFSLGHYDHTQPLWIDPRLEWNTFLGGSGEDVAFSIVVDSNRTRMFVIGNSSSGWGNPIRPYSNSTDAFVAQINISGTLIWNTFLGGLGDDAGYDITLDDNGDIYVTGNSSNSWGLPVRPISGTDAFVAKINGDNGNLIWNTFLGGGSGDYGQAIVIDGNEIYVGGYSYASWHEPVLSYTAGSDAFVARLSTSDGALNWNTFLGGLASDFAWDLDVITSTLYVAGFSNNSWGSPVNPYVAAYDGFIAQLSTTFGTLSRHSFVGGSANDYIHHIDVNNDAIYGVGRSFTNWGTPVRPYQGGVDILVTRMFTNGLLSWHTFLGGPDIDYGYGIAVDADKNVYVSGESNSVWGIPHRQYSGNTDGIVARLNGTTGALLWNSFLGSQLSDRGRNLALDNNKNVYAIGHSEGSWGAPIRPYSSITDVYISRLATNFEIFIPKTLRGLSITQNFESQVMPPGNWTRITTNPTQTWKIYTASSQGAASAAVLTDTAPQNEVLLSPFFGGPSAQLTFQHTGNSHFCGTVADDNCDFEVWVVRGNWDGIEDQMIYLVDSAWTSQWDWHTTSIDLTPYMAAGPMKVAFRYVAPGGGNGGYALLDSISIVGP